MSNVQQQAQEKEGLVKRQARSHLEKAKGIAQRDGSALASVAKEGVSSGAYLYPLYGILFFLRNTKLLEGVFPLIRKSAMWSLGVTVAMFVFTYLPQVAVLALFTGPLAPIAALPVLFGEIYVISNFLVRSFILPGATEKIFDAVLVQKGHKELVERGRTLKSGRGGGTVLGKSLLKPVSSKFSTEGLVRYIITLPLNFIPAVGTAVFLFLNGQSAGPSYHSRYFQLKGMDKKQKEQFVAERRGAYTSMGAVSVALGLVPVVGTLFGFTSAVGAALYACDLEKNNNSQGGAQGEAGGADQIEVGMGSKDEL